MKILNRLSKYLLGVLIGLALIFWKDGGCNFSWLPGKQIKEEIRDKGIMENEEVACFLDCYGLTVSDLADLVTEGSIDFWNRDRTAKPRKYLIESDDSKINSATFVLTDSTATVVKVDFIELKSCDC